MSDDGALRVLELNPLEALELERSVERVWGFGLVQTFERPTIQQAQTDAYIGFRHYALDIDLLGINGRAVPTRPISDWSAVLAGIRLRWGKIDKDEAQE
jgi:hypothetical protein